MPWWGWLILGAIGAGILAWVVVEELRESRWDKALAEELEDVDADGW